MSGRYLVVGLRRSGIAACEAIARVWPGAEILAADGGTDLDVSRLAALGIEARLGGDLEPVDGLTALVKSPGVPGEAAQVAAARAAGVPVWSEVELAAPFLKGRTIGITGSNGKTTTTSLIGHILKESGVTVQVGGNIGLPVTAMLDSSRDDGWNVLESVRAIAPGMPVIILTGAASDEDRERTRAHGVRLVSKPFDLSELKAAVRDALAPNETPGQVVRKGLTAPRT